MFKRHIFDVQKIFEYIPKYLHLDEYFEFYRGSQVLDFISENEYQKLRFKVENLGV